MTAIGSSPKAKPPVAPKLDPLSGTPSWCVEGANLYFAADYDNNGQDLWSIGE